eukprot:2661819-Pleurochrysis_carterae.AAC.1
MKGDCNEFVTRCEVCNARRLLRYHMYAAIHSQSLRIPLTRSMWMHKTMPRSLDTKFHYILIV